MLQVSELTNWKPCGGRPGLLGGNANSPICQPRAKREIAPRLAGPFQPSGGRMNPSKISSGGSGSGTARAPPAPAGSLAAGGAILPGGPTPGGNPADPGIPAPPPIPPGPTPGAGSIV